RSEGGPGAVPRRGERGGARAALEAGTPGLRSRRHALEEGVLGAVQPRQPVLEHRTVEGGVLRERGTALLPLRFLLLAADAAPLPAPPPGQAVCQCRVVEQAAAPPHLLQRPLLAGRWPGLLFGGRAECAVGLPAGQALLPRTSCCLIDCTPARGRTAASSPVACGGLVSVSAFLPGGMLPSRRLAALRRRACKLTLCLAQAGRGLV